jgi:DNA-binding CsgD family transcriptional regulator
MTRSNAASTWALGDLAEAATHTGRVAEAREIAAAFQPGELDSVAPWTRVARLYAAPFLAEDLPPRRSSAGRRELRATGEEPRAPQRTCLPPEELQIAQLAAGGLSNRAIAERLYLSHRTVGSRLYRIFPKLGITSRIQLPSALATVDASPAAGS